MHQRTASEIEAFVREVWTNTLAARWGYFRGEADVQLNEVNLLVAAKYEAPPLTLRKLMRLAEFFDTRNIEVEPYQERIGECNDEFCGENCDYHSWLGWKLLIGA